MYIILMLLYQFLTIEDYALNAKDIRSATDVIRQFLVGSIWKCNYELRMSWIPETVLYVSM